MCSIYVCELTSDDDLFHPSQKPDHCICTPGYGGADCSESYGPSHAITTPIGDVFGLNYSLSRIGHSLVSCDDNTIYMFGGYTAERGLLNDLWKYDPDKDEWTFLKPATSDEPSPRLALFLHNYLIVPWLKYFSIRQWVKIN